MADTLDPQNKPAKPSPEELEARWQQMMQEVSDQPRNPDVLIRAGNLAEELGRKAEAYIYFQKVINLDPTKSFIIGRMRRLASTPDQQKEVETLARRPASFGKALDDVFVYPLRSGGIGILILGAIFFYGCRLVAHYNVVFPWISWMVVSITAAYLSMFYVDVVNTTVTGSEDLPEWPDPVRFREFFMDWAKIGTAYVVAFLPVIILIVVLFYVRSQASTSHESSDAEFRPPPYLPHQPETVFIQETDPDDASTPADPLAPRPARLPHAAPVRPAQPSSTPVALLIVILVPALIFTLLGFVYLPMGMLANCVYGHPMACINAFFIVRSIGVARKNYAICVLAYFGVAAAAGVLEVLARLPGIFIFSSALATLLEIYGGVVQMRILGIFYRMNQARLGWMSD